MNNPFEALDARLSRIENYMLEHLPKKVETTGHPEQPLTIKEAAEFLNLAVPTIYSKVSKGELPVCKAPGSKRLYFSRTELLEYLKSGRKKSNAEIIAEANTYLSNRKGKSRE